MMHTPMFVRALAGASLVALAGAAHAQDAQTAATTPQASATSTDTTGVMPDAAVSAAAAGTDSGDIIVTARRRDESLQDVPQTINAVTGNTLEKLNLQRFEDVSAVVPGLNLNTGAAGNTGTGGYGSGASLRGATFNAESSATPTVEFYINDALVQSNFLFQSFFDVGQLEVLRGPQGTLRGRASPSGALTLTTRKPDLQEVGGYFNGTGTSRGGINVNGAVNVPLISDVLALRVAAIVDHNDSDFSRSVNTSKKSYSETQGVRASLRFEPTDWINANLMYQHIDRKALGFQTLESLSLIDPSIPATNPVIEAGDRRGIQEDGIFNHNKQDLVTGQINLRFGGQQLSYVGSYSKATIDSQLPKDFANILRNYEYYDNTDSRPRQWTHELRLASEERLFDMFDYTVGVFYSDFNSPTDQASRTAVTLNGNIAAVVTNPVQRRGGSKETSFFGNLTWHIGPRTELSGGARYIDYKLDSELNVAGNTLINDQRKSRPVVYNAQLSHRISDALLIYANTGSSWRAGPQLIGVFRPLTPRLSQFTQLDDEKSKSYEAGFKSTLLDRRLRVNVAYFHQDFKNYIYRGNPIYYVDIDQNGAKPNIFNFGSSVDAKIDGIDADLAFQFSRRFSIGSTLSYAKSKIKNQQIACNDLNGDGVPDAFPSAPTVAQITASAGGDAVAACSTNGPISFSPRLNITAQSEYAVPVMTGIDAYVRGLYSFAGKTQADPDVPFDNLKAYGLLNVYTGIRSPNGAWELSLFVKNITNEGSATYRASNIVATSVQALQPPTFRTTLGQAIGANYIVSRYTPPREFGVNLRYAFGSR